MTVAPLTTRIRAIPVEVPIDVSDGVSRPCVVNFDTVTTVGKHSLRERIAVLSSARMREVEDALHFALGLET